MREKIITFYTLNRGFTHLVSLQGLIIPRIFHLRAIADTPVSRKVPLIEVPVTSKPLLLTLTKSSLIGEYNLLGDQYDHLNKIDKAVDAEFLKCLNALLNCKEAGVGGQIILDANRDLTVRSVKKVSSINYIPELDINLAIQLMYLVYIKGYTEVQLIKTSNSEITIRDARNLKVLGAISLAMKSMRIRKPGKEYSMAVTSDDFLFSYLS